MHEKTTNETLHVASYESAEYSDAMVQYKLSEPGLSFVVGFNDSVAFGLLSGQTQSDMYLSDFVPASCSAWKRIRVETGRKVPSG